MKSATLFPARQNKLILLLILAFSFCGQRAGAQTEMSVAITLVDDNNQPLSGADVQLQELATHHQLHQRSDGQGIAQFSLTTPGEYEVAVNGQVQSSDPVTVKANQVGSTSFFLTYNPELQQRQRRQSFLRSGLTEIPVQGSVAPEDVASGYNRIEILIENTAQQAQAGKRVSLVDLAGKKRYTARTNADGYAFFHCPGKVAYDIDVEEQLNAGYVMQDQLEGYTLTQKIVYDQYDMVETRRNDTVVQTIHFPVEQKHSRALYRVRVKRDGKAWANGNIYLDEIHGSTVYKAKTDAAGESVFILPFGKKFMIHFPYQRDLDVVNLIDARNIASGSLDVTYTPNPALEHPERYVPTRHELMLTEFPYYHRTPYPSPSDPSKPGLVLRTGGVSPEAVVEIGIGAHEGAQRNRRPLNMSFVLDVSGSMAGNDRIESLKRGLVRFLNLLKPDDVISIILFNDGPKLLVPAQLLGRDRDKIIALVQAIEPSGGTNMLGALQAGYQQALSFYKKGGANTLVVLSDGYDSNTVETLLAAQNPYRDRIFCTAIGVGNDYNYDLLKKLVTRSQDLLQQAHEGKELEDLFGEKLITLGLPLYRDIKIEVSWDPAILCSQHFGLRNTVVSATGLTASVPDIFPNQELPSLLSFTRKAGQTGKATYMVNVTMTYENLQSGKREQRSELIAVSFNSETPPVTGMEAEERRKMFAVAFSNDYLLRMSTFFENKNWAETAKVLEEGQARLKALYGKTTDPDITALLARLALYRTALQRLAYKTKVGD
jgi:hypothetical protein